MCLECFESPNELDHQPMHVEVKRMRSSMNSLGTGLIGVPLGCEMA